MARPTLFTHRKFLRLAAILRMPKPHVLGHLEYLWESGYRSACSIVGDEIDIELVSEWQGESGAFAKALIETGFVDRTELGLEIHDFWTHAPEYVKKRVITEQRLSDAGTTLSEVRRLAGLAGVAAKQAKAKQTQANGQQTESNLLRNQANVQQNGSLPSLSFPSPPIASESSNELSPAPDKPAREEKKDDAFEIFWKAYPRKIEKKSAREVWRKLRLDSKLNVILAALEIQKQDYNWTKEGGRFIIYPKRWLERGRWDDEVTIDLPPVVQQPSLREPPAYLHLPEEVWEAYFTEPTMSWDDPGIVEWQLKLARRTPEEKEEARIFIERKFREADLLKKNGATGGQ